MSGKRLMIAFLVLLAAFTAALVWFQFFAFYQRSRDVAALTIDGEAVPVADYDGIDAASSPLKLRGCFTLDPAATEGLAPVEDATPLTAPFWFRCFDARRLTADLADGLARAFALTRNDPAGFDLMLAVYPDGRGYIWRQLDARFTD